MPSTVSTSKIGRREWWKYIYTIDQRYENHEKFLKVHISIYMYTPVHFMEPQFGLELCLLSQILKNCYWLFIVEHIPIKWDNCAILIDRPNFSLHTSGKQSKVLTCLNITTGNYISIYEIGPVKTLPAIKQDVYLPGTFYGKLKWRYCFSIRASINYGSSVVSEKGNLFKVNTSLLRAMF